MHETTHDSRDSISLSSLCPRDRFLLPCFDIRASIAFGHNGCNKLASDLYDRGGGGVIDASACGDTANKVVYEQMTGGKL